MGQLFENISGAGAARTEAKSTQNLAEFNAAVSVQEAKGIRATAGFESRRQAVAGAKIKSAQTAAIATSGGLSSPVAADLAEAQAVELEIDNLLIGFEAATRAQRAETQADIDRLGGKIARQRGKNIARARNIELATTIGTAAAGTKTGKTLLSGF